jgi:hypothetical protein
MTTIVIGSSGPIGRGDRGGSGGELRVWSGGRVVCDNGQKFSATTAFGMTETINGSSEARRTVFSLLGLVSRLSQQIQGMTDQVWLTQIA